MKPDQTESNPTESTNPNQKDGSEEGSQASLDYLMVAVFLTQQPLLCLSVTVVSPV